MFLKKCVFALCILLSNKYTNAQVLLSESFDSTTFAPAGWTLKKTAPSGTPLDWDRVISGVNNVPMPHSGVGMARFNSAATASGSVAEIATPALNLSAAGSYRLKFWMYRGDNSLNSNDVLSVYINTSAPSTTFASNMANLAVSRNLTPVEGANGWYQYSIELFNSPTYYIIFKATGTHSNNIFYIDDIIVERYNCDKPQGSPSAINLTPNSATIQWYVPSGGTPTKYEYEVRTGGSPNSGSLGLAASGTVAPTASFVNSADITGLLQGYQHTIYVRTICGPDTGSWTAPVTFNTPCNGFPIPYTENFDAALSATGLGICMQTKNYNGAAGNWRRVSSPVASAPNAVLTVSTGSTLGNPGQDFLFTAPLALQAGKCYKVNFSYTCNGNNESIEVKYGTTATLAGMTTTLFSRSNFYLTSFQQGEAFFYVTSSGDYYIGFGCTTPAGYSNGLVLDNISVAEAGCGNVTGVNATNITTNSATINWPVPGCGITNGYEWELREAGAAGSGAAGLISSGTTGAATTSAFVAGLQMAKDYTAYVRANCGDGGLGQWSAAYIFKSACNNVSLPYKENFDSVTAPALPGCVFITNVNGAGSWSNNANRPHSAPNCMFFDYTNGRAGDDWFFTPPVAMVAGTSYRLTFYYMANFPDEPEALEIKYGNAPSPSAMTGAAIFSNTNIVNTIYRQAIVDFTPPISQAYTIGFHEISQPTQSYFRVDDIVVDYTPQCDSVRQLYAADVTPYAATIKWTAPFKGAPASYDWELRVSGAAGSGSTGLLSSGALTAGSLGCPISGMLPGNSYSFYIRSGCDAMKGEWIKLDFVSACLPVNPLYTENFDDIIAPLMPACTRTENKDDDTYVWRTYGLAAFANSQPNLLWFYPNFYAPADDWFYTKPLNLVAGNTYRLTFYYREYSGTYRDALEVKLGNYAQSSSMTLTTLFTTSSISNTQYKKVTVNFTPPASGTFYIGFHCFSVTNQTDLFVDDISVSSLGACAGSNVIIPAGITGSSYQWQVSTGGGFTNILNNTNYSGTNQASLTVSSIPANFSDYQYRCLVDGIPSSVYTLKIYLEWQGTVDDNWHNAANWGNCNVVPGQYTEVLVPSGKTKYPKVSTNTTVKKLTTENGSTVNIQNGVILEIKGN